MKSFISLQSCLARISGLIFLICLSFHANGNKDNNKPSGTKSSDSELVNQLNQLIKDFRGDVGIYVHHFPTDHEVSIRADELFPTASMIKVPIMLSLFSKMETGELDYHEGQIYHDSLLYPGEDILGSFKDGEKIALSKLVMLMITTSDNTASLWCQHLAGTGVDINNWLEDNGFNKTRVNSRTPCRRGNWEKYGWGQTTAREMSGLVTMIREGKAVSKDASEEMYRVLCNIYWNGESLSQIPPYVQAASKQGAVNQSRSEVVLVNAPSGDYVFCIITNNQEDESWEYSNEGFQLIRKVSKLLWEYFEPESKWEPARGAEDWAK
ncbi:MAG: serine hydrolase [Bacteroidales bacterium]|nr:serine hydrolase [Bacteroidales bacterium]